ncbi:MAG: tandem-95 repeat protein [Kangiella sp.]|nr:tandem-95 repeat protein [Kangiella sp.]
MRIIKSLLLLLSALISTKAYGISVLNNLEVGKEAKIINGQFTTSIQLPNSKDTLIIVPNITGYIESANIEIVFPSGLVVNQTNAVTNNVTFMQHIPKNMHESLVYPADSWLIHLENITAGEYIVRGTASASEYIPVNVKILDSSVQYIMDIGDPTQSINVNSVVPISIFLSDENGPYSQATATYKVWNDAGLIGEFIVKDDGTGTDSVANDGAYDVSFLPQVAGSYNVEVTLNGIDSTNSDSYSSVYATFKVTDNKAEINKNYVESTVDLDNDGYFDKLVLEFPVTNVTVIDGKFNAYCKIILSDGTKLDSFKSIDIGENRIYVEYSGRQIRERNHEGVISVEKCIFKHNGKVLNIFYDLRDTASYGNDVWERETVIFIGEVVDSAVDVNADGFYDHIKVGFKVDSIVPGSYGFSVSGYSESNKKAGVYGSDSLELAQGINTVEFLIPDYSFSGLGEETSLDLRNLYLYPKFGADTSLLQEQVGKTNVYNCWDFRGCQNGPNSVPIAVNDEALSDGSSIFVNVVSNDTDSDGDLLKLNSITQPLNGSVSIVGNSVEYTPISSFTGTDTFQYEIVDVHSEHKVLKGGSASATVTVTVVNNSVPVANDDSYTVAKNIQTQLFVLENDTDADGDNLYITEVSSPTNGTVTNYGNSIVYEPSSNYEGKDTFTYTIVDVDKDTNIAKNGYDTATVLIEVGSIINDPPVASDDNFAIKANTTEILDVLANDYDPDGDQIYISQYSLPGQGTVEVVNNKIHYTSNEGATGTDSFAYEVSDTKGGKAIAAISISFIVENENSPPVANDDEITTLSGSAVTVDVLANDTDTDGDTLNIESFTNGSYGTVVQSGNNLVYTPESNYAGTDSFAYIISDGNGGSSTAVVAVIVEAANSQPVANDDSVSTLKDTAISIDVLANDTDSDNDTLLIANVTQGQNGSAEISGSNIVYSPNADFVGIDTFIYTISDGELTSEAIVEVTVLDENKAPVANDDIGDIYQGDSALFDVLNNDEDQNGDSLSVIAVSEPLPNHGSVSIQSNSIHYVAPTDFVGQVSVIYTISDGALTAESTLTINVNEKYQGPLISISSPEDGSNFYSGTAILFSSVLEVSNGDDLSNEVNWYSSIDGFLGNGVQIEREISSGEHEITVKVVDASGNEAADNIWIKVLPNTGNSYSSSVEHDIPDNKGYGVSSTINIEDNMTAMSIEIQADINHPELKDLAFQLVAPGGKHYNLENPGKYSANKIWKLDLNNPIEIKGAWTLKVSDQKKDNVGKILGWRITFE